MLELMEVVLHSTLLKTIGWVREKLNFEVEVDEEFLSGTISYTNPNYDFLGNQLITTW